MIKLGETRGSREGVYCGAEGLYLGCAALIARRDGRYRQRANDEIAALLAAAYGTAEAMSRVAAGLLVITAALNGNDLSYAMIAALQLGLGGICEEGLRRVTQADALSKHNFNPDEPRDWHGRWTTEAGISSETPIPVHHPAPTSAREFLPSADHENPSSTQTAQNTPLDFSPHALSRMQERGIAADQVIDAIRNGSRVTQPNGNIRCTGVGCVVIISPSGRIVTVY